MDLRPVIAAVVLGSGLAAALARADRTPASDDKGEDKGGDNRGKGDDKPDHMKAIPTGRTSTSEAAGLAVDGFQWEPFGYLRLQYIAVQNDENVAFVGRDDGFELQNARIGVHGTWPGRADFVVSIDG